MNKFRAIKTVVDNITFDSKREAAVYGELKLRQRAGEICDLEVHPKFDLTVGKVKIATYKPDFTYADTTTSYLHVVDVKSPPTAKKRDFVLIRKLFRALHGFDIEVVF